MCEASEAEVMRLNSVRLVRRLALVDKKWMREHGDGDDGDDDEGSRLTSVRGVAFMKGFDSSFL